jgi:NIMA (never in mitosis gene a)-related kinase 1/4/5
MDDDGKKPNRMKQVKMIRKYKVVEVVRFFDKRVVYTVESMKNAGNMFSIYALDLLDTTELDKNIFLNEIRLFASIKHPFVLYYHECFVDKSNGLLCCVLEYADSMNYNEIMFRLTYARIHVSMENLYKLLFYSSLLMFEMEKYGVGFLEMNPKSFLQTVDGEIRLGAFCGVIHPFMDMKRDKLNAENLL